MFTSFFQYLLLSPSFTNILNVYVRFSPFSRLYKPPDALDAPKATRSAIYKMFRGVSELAASWATPRAPREGRDRSVAA